MSVSARFILGAHFADHSVAADPAPAVAPPRDGPELGSLLELGMFPTFLVTTDSINGYNPISKWLPHSSLPPLMTNLCFVSASRHMVSALVGVIRSPDMAHILFFGIIRSHSDKGELEGGRKRFNLFTAKARENTKHANSG